MAIRVHMTGLSESELKLRLAAKAVDPVVRRELAVLGGEAVLWLQKKVKSGALGLAPKRHPDGKPPLVDTGTYINSYDSEVSDDNTLSIEAKGTNTNMANADLGELLEYGWGNVPARPHIRPLVRWVLQTQAEKFWQRVIKGVGL
jgi:hypothetical protein